MTNHDKIWFAGRLLIYIFSFTLLLLLPWRYIDRGPVLCLFRRFFGINCLGCGMTRAFWQIVHLNFRQAFQFNSFSMLLFPVCITLISWDILRGIKELFSCKT